MRNKKNSFRLDFFERMLFLSACFCLAGAVSAIAQDKDASPAPEALKDWPMIEKEYQALRADRDNILAQVKLAYDDKNKVLDELRLTKEKAEKAISEKDALEKKLEAYDKEKADLDEKISSFEVDNKDLSSQVASLQKLNTALTQENQEFLNRPNPQADMAIQAPQSLMKAVKDREQMVRENADMHYNLGVLLAKNQEYRNAAVEFKRAIELRNDDAASYFNLGKIYADFYKDKVKSVEYFKKYLEINPQAEDRNWVENFITTIKSWKAEEKIA